jgi:hypothetical protein
MEHQLPANVITAIELVVAVPDPNPKRESRLKAIEILRKTGFV